MLLPAGVMDELELTYVVCEACTRHTKHLSVYTPHKTFKCVHATQKTEVCTRHTKHLSVYTPHITPKYVHATRNI